jgi:acetate kinase
MREVLADRAAGDLEATTAVRTYLHWLRREIAAAASSLECLDALVLTADSVSVLHLVRGLRTWRSWSWGRGTRTLIRTRWN